MLSFVVYILNNGVKFFQLKVNLRNSGRVWTDDPAPPGEADYLEFTDVGEDFVRLKWKGTTEMGDGDFKGYIIEKCKEGTDLWIPCNLGPEMAADCQYKVDGLVTGQTYFFRVVAVSTVGQVIFVFCHYSGTRQQLESLQEFASKNFDS